MPAAITRYEMGRVCQRVACNCEALHGSFVLPYPSQQSPIGQCLLLPDDSGTRSFMPDPNSRPREILRIQAQLVTTHRSNDLDARKFMGILTAVSEDRRIKQASTTPGYIAPNYQRAQKGLPSILNGNPRMMRHHDAIKKKRLSF
jgi:hypothetical protein